VNSTKKALLKIYARNVGTMMIVKSKIIRAIGLGVLVGCITIIIMVKWVL